MGALYKRFVLGVREWHGLGRDGLLVPFPAPRTIDAALANLTVGDDSPEAFQDRLQAAQEENNV